MRSTIIGIIAVLLVILAAWAGAQEEYAPAAKDYGKMNAVWKYAGRKQLQASPGHILVAADIQLPAPPDGRFDLDDIDIFDADTGENFGSGPDIQRLTPSGEFVNGDDPEVKDRKDYRGIFVWEVPETVKKVNFGYWGDMLFVKPFPVQKTGRTIPETKVNVVAIESDGPASEQYRIFRGILHASNWYRAMDPSGYTLFSSAVPEKYGTCDWERWIEIDASYRRVIDLPVLKRAYVLPDRYFLIEYWCRMDTQPDALNLYGTHDPLPAFGDLKLPPEITTALQKGHRNEHPRHRMK